MSGAEVTGIKLDENPNENNGEEGKCSGDIENKNVRDGQKDFAGEASMLLKGPELSLVIYNSSKKFDEKT